MSEGNEALNNVDKLKAEGNAAFSAGNYSAAEQSYSAAIDAAKAAEAEAVLAVLYSNRAAARLQQDRFDDALEDSDEALRRDEKMVKAYHRRASALLGLDKVREAYHTYVNAVEYANTKDEKRWVQHKVWETEKLWSARMRVQPVESSEDFLERYCMTDLQPRDRLSTMAYFWNESSLTERFNHFRTLLRLLVGPDAPIPPSLDNIEETAMSPLPTENYDDLPPVEVWIEFFRNLSTEEKTELMRGMWDALDELEKNIVLNDVRAFIAQAVSPELGSDEAKQESSEQESKEIAS